MSASCYDNQGNEYSAVVNEGIYKESSIGIVTKLFDVDTVGLVDQQIYFPLVDQQSNEPDWRLIAVFDPTVKADEGGTFVWNPVYSEYRQLFFDDGVPVRIRTKTKEATEYGVYRGTDDRLYVAKRLDTTLVYDYDTDQLLLYVPTEFPVPPSCGNPYPTWTTTTVFTSFHKLVLSGDQVLTIHKSGKSVPSSYVLDSTQPCNQVAAVEAWAIDDAVIFVYDRKRRLHYSSDGGNTWSKLDGRHASILTCNKVSGLVTIEPNTGNPLEFDHATRRFKRIVVSDTNIKLVDTLTVLTYNSLRFIGQGKEGIWTRTGMGTTSSWHFRGPINHKTIIPTHASMDGTPLAHCTPIHQFQFDSVTGNWDRRVRSFGAAIPSEIRQVNQQVVAKFQNRRSLHVAFGPHLEGTITGKVFTSLCEMIGPGADMNPYLVTSFGATSMGKVATLGNEIYLKATDMLSWEKLDSITLRTITSESPVDVVCKGEDSVLILTDSILAVVSIPTRSVIEVKDAGNSVRPGAGVFHPGVTAEAKYEKDLVLGLGVVRFEDNPFEGGTILIPYPYEQVHLYPVTA